MEGEPGRYEPLEGVDDCTLLTDEEINELQPLRPDKLVADQDTSKGCGWVNPNKPSIQGTQLYQIVVQSMRGSGDSETLARWLEDRVSELYIFELEGVGDDAVAVQLYGPGKIDWVVARKGDLFVVMMLQRIGLLDDSEHGECVTRLAAKALERLEEAV